MFTFNPQSCYKEAWINLTSTNDNPAGVYSQFTDGPDEPFEQTAPVNDKIFMIDMPNVNASVGGDTVYEANADNLVNCIYIRGVGAVASGANYWYSHVKAVLLNSSVESIILTANTGNPTLPTHWLDTNW